MKKFQFLYHYNDLTLSECDKVAIIKAKTIKGACGKFIRNRKCKIPRVDHEVMDIKTGDYFDISNVASIKEFVI